MKKTQNLNNVKKILDKHLKLCRIKTGTDIPNKTYIYIIHAMGEYARYSINKRDSLRRSGRTKLLLHIPKIFRLLYWQYFILWLRKRHFLIAVKNAKIRADVENRKIYVIRKGTVSYKLLSTQDISLNKRLRIIKNNINDKELRNLSDYVAIPSLNTK